MKLLDLFKTNCLLVLSFMCSMLVLPAMATTVEVQTTEGTFVINLYDFDPGLQDTVSNFLDYVESGSYNNTYFHRLTKNISSLNDPSSDTPVVLQGGGFIYDGPLPLPDDTAFAVQNVTVINPPPLANFPKYSNVRGTIAMAKTALGPDTATNQWYINLSDNANAFDTPFNNGGFTVFGKVTVGIDVVETLASYTPLSRVLSPQERDPVTMEVIAEPVSAAPNTAYFYNLLNPFDGSAALLANIPVQNYSKMDFTNNISLLDANIPIINSMTVLDATQDTASTLDIPFNGLALGFRGNPVVNNDEFKGGGSIGVIFLGLLSVLFFYRRRFK